jgi:hypothetical protein
MTIPTLLDDLKTQCETAGLGFRYRKTGGIKPLKPCHGQCIFRVTCGGSVVITGTDTVSDEEWSAIADEANRISTGGWSYYR